MLNLFLLTKWPEKDHGSRKSIDTAEFNLQRSVSTRRTVLERLERTNQSSDFRWHGHFALGQQQ